MLFRSTVSKTTYQALAILVALPQTSWYTRSRGQWHEKLNQAGDGQRRTKFRACSTACSVQPSRDLTCCQAGISFFIATALDSGFGKDDSKVGAGALKC